MIAQSSMKLLDHLHILSQEALDHADLSVLTGTIGTVTLVRNTIWIYNQQLIKTKLGYDHEFYLCFIVMIKRKNINFA